MLQLLATFHLIFLSQSLTATEFTATENADFIFNDQTVQFQLADTQITRQVVINNDTAVESTESFNVSLTSNDKKVEIQDPDTTLISIVDNDGTVFVFLFGRGGICLISFMRHFKKIENFSFFIYNIFSVIIVILSAWG